MTSPIIRMDRENVGVEGTGPETLQALDSVNENNTNPDQKSNMAATPIGQRKKRAQTVSPRDDSDNEYINAKGNKLANDAGLKKTNRK